MYFCWYFIPSRACVAEDASIHQCECPCHSGSGPV